MKKKTGGKTGGFFSLTLSGFIEVHRKLIFEIILYVIVYQVIVAYTRIDEHRLRTSFQQPYGLL